ncbi:hypothetical protein AMTRI_Chr12g273030 [Amborella trichopoda]
MRGQQSRWIWSEAAPPWPRVLFGSIWKSLSLYFEKNLFLFLLFSPNCLLFISKIPLAAIFITASLSFYLSAKLSAFPNFDREEPLSLSIVLSKLAVIVVGLYRISEANAMNLLYCFERLNIQNYFLLGEGRGVLV